MSGKMENIAGEQEACLELKGSKPSESGGKAKIIALCIGIAIVFTCLGFGVAMFMGGGFSRKCFYLDSPDQQCALRHVYEKGWFKEQKLKAPQIASGECNAAIANMKAIAKKKVEILKLNYDFSPLKSPSRMGPDDNEDDDYTKKVTGMEDLMIMSGFLDRLVAGAKECMPISCHFMPQAKANGTVFMCTLNYDTREQIEHAKVDFISAP